MSWTSEQSWRSANWSLAAIGVTVWFDIVAGAAIVVSRIGVFSSVVAYESVREAKRWQS